MAAYYRKNMYNFEQEAGKKISNVTKSLKRRGKMKRANMGFYVKT
jgi:hypothetical protein